MIYKGRGLNELALELLKAAFLFNDYYNPHKKIIILVPINHMKDHNSSIFLA